MSMSLQPWAELVTRGVRAWLPDVRAARRGETVVWMRGNSIATITPAGASAWELVITTNGKMTIRTYPERTDVDTARVAAGNIVAHFDARWCRGIDHEPYSEAYMRANEQARPLRSML
jgi:hypothetical protein